MFGSQALETGIGLALLFFLLSIAASAAVEALSKILGLRHSYLETAISHMLAGTNSGGADSLDGSAKANGPTPEVVLADFKKTSVYSAVCAAAGNAGASYLSAKSFADAAMELYDKASNKPAALTRRVDRLNIEVEKDIVGVKAGLERWFDETMDALESRYKKWATTCLFVVGLLLALAMNASAINVASDLWSDSTTRQAVVAAAEQVTANGDGGSTITSVADATDKLVQIGLPIGWSQPQTMDGYWWITHVLGWLMTAALLMLGSPFWFELLSRLVSLRSGGAAPDKAVKDPGAATMLRVAPIPNSSISG